MARRERGRLAIVGYDRRGEPFGFVEPACGDQPLRAFHHQALREAAHGAIEVTFERHVTQTGQHTARNIQRVGVPTNVDR